MQVLDSQLRFTNAEFSDEQTLMKACSVVTWNFFTTLKSPLVWDLVIKDASM